MLAGCRRALLAAASVDLAGENNHMDRVTNYLQEPLDIMDMMMRSYRGSLLRIEMSPVVFTTRPDLDRDSGDISQFI